MVKLELCLADELLSLLKSVGEAMPKGTLRGVTMSKSFVKCYDSEVQSHR